MNRCIDIQSLVGREILDSRGNPSVKVECELQDGTCTPVPSGASTGSREAVELRDSNVRRYRGRGILQVIANVSLIKPLSKGHTRAAHGTCRTFFREVSTGSPRYSLPETARQLKIAGVAAPSTTNSMNLVRFTIQFCHRSGTLGIKLSANKINYQLKLGEIAMTFMAHQIQAASENHPGVRPDCGRYLDSKYYAH